MGKPNPNPGLRTPGHVLPCGAPASGLKGELPKRQSRRDQGGWFLLSRSSGLPGRGAWPWPCPGQGMGATVKLAGCTACGAEGREAGAHEGLATSRVARGPGRPPAWCTPEPPMRGRRASQRPSLGSLPSQNPERPYLRTESPPKCPCSALASEVASRSTAKPPGAPGHWYLTEGAFYPNCARCPEGPATFM